MKRFTWMNFGLLSLLLSALSVPSSSLNPRAEGEVTVKLVLGEGATLPGYEAEDDETIYHHNVVTYHALPETTLPQAEKPGTTFISWVYAEGASLVRVARMPKTSGAIYYAYYEGDGTLATSTSSEEIEPTTLYLQAKNGTVDWSQAGAIIKVYTWGNGPTMNYPGMTMLSLGDGLYALELNYLPSNLLFARLNPNNQSEVWNQTVDLTYVSPLNLFTLTSWDNGTWSTFTA